MNLVSCRRSAVFEHQIQCYLHTNELNWFFTCGRWYLTQGSGCVWIKMVNSILGSRIIIGVFIPMFVILLARKRQNATFMLIPYICKMAVFGAKVSPNGGHDTQWVESPLTSKMICFSAFFSSLRANICISSKENGRSFSWIFRFWTWNPNICLKWGKIKGDLTPCDKTVLC